MPPRLPLEVHSLLNSDSQAERDSAWESFLASHSRLILYVARSVTRDGDETLDAYTWALERLKEDESRRLRGFSEATGTLFSTWLVVVIRRLCLDFLRHKRGRVPKAPGGRSVLMGRIPERASRRGSSTRRSRRPSTHCPRRTASFCRFDSKTTCPLPRLPA
jgi:DNA-directed RNA polymerase specialized sigma24 family protein